MKQFVGSDSETIINTNINIKEFCIPMTLIIGARCTDGVVIVADKKVVEGTDVTSQNKISILPLGIAVAGAGIKEIIDKFNERIPSLLELRREENYQKFQQVQGYENILLEQAPYYTDKYLFLEDCEDILKLLYDKYICENQQFHSSILVGVIVDNKAELHFLDTISCLDSKRSTYKSIGSGSNYADFLLKKLWNNKLTMIEMAKICTFIINYIETTKIDNYVGNGIQIVIVPDCPNKELTETEIKKYSTKEIELNEFVDKKIITKMNDFFIELSKEINQ